MTASVRLRAVALAALTLLLTAAMLPMGGATQASAVTSREPGVNAVDLVQVTVSSTPRRVRFTFDYATTFTAPDPTTAGDVTKPYWWGATIYFDTNKRHNGPEFAAFLTNQCGDGYVIGRVVRKRSHGSSYLAIAPEWEGGCGGKQSCARTAKVKYADDLGSLRSITFRRVKGCYDAKRVRVSAEFRTGPFGATKDDWTTGRDLLDEFPGTGLKQYTGWTRKRGMHVYADQSAGLVTSTTTSQAP